MRQSFRQEFTNGWKPSFPLSISDDARSFVILRGLFVLQPTTESAPALCQSTIIPMEFSKALDARWTDRLEVLSTSREIIQDLPPVLQNLQFSANGDYLYFSDCCRFSSISHSAVFQIRNQGDLKVKRLGMGVISSGSILFPERKLMDKIVFIPSILS